MFLQPVAVVSGIWVSGVVLSCSSLGQCQLQSMPACQPPVLSKLREVRDSISHLTATCFSKRGDSD